MAVSRNQKDFKGTREVNRYRSDAPRRNQCSRPARRSSFLANNIQQPVISDSSPLRSSSHRVSIDRRTRETAQHVGSSPLWFCTGPSRFIFPRSAEGGYGGSVMCEEIDLDRSPLLNDGYRRCLYIELKCEQCNCYWRMCIEPEAAVACPNCPSTSFIRTELATGLTRQELPIIELYLSARDPAERRIERHVECLMPYFAEIRRRGKKRLNFNY